MLIRLTVVALALFLATGALILTVLLIPREQDYRYVQQYLRGGAELSAARLEAAQDEGKALADLEELHGVPLTVVTGREAVPGELGAEPGALRYRTEGLEEYLWMRLSDGRVLRWGPYPSWPAPPVYQLLLALGVSVLLWILALFLALRPTVSALAALERAARELEQGRWAARAQEHPDVAALARAFNRMAGHTEAVLAERQALLHAVSHELRTPLARLEYAVHDLASAEPAERARAREEAQEELDALDGLVGELLDWARAGKPPQRERVEARPLVEERAARLGVDLRIEGDTTLNAEPAAVARVVDNLLVNATRHGAPPIRVRLAPNLLAVEDAGPGIPPQEGERLLRPFQRGSDRSVAGTGLGLAIVARILEGHGGRVELRDAPTGGLAVWTFWGQPGGRSVEARSSL